MYKADRFHKSIPDFPLTAGEIPQAGMCVTLCNHHAQSHQSSEQIASNLLVAGWLLPNKGLHLQLHQGGCYCLLSHNREV